MHGPPCVVCGTSEIAGMCPNRYLSDHDQHARDRAECTAWVFMVADGRSMANRDDWKQAWTGREPPLAIVTWPG